MGLRLAQFEDAKSECARSPPALPSLSHSTRTRSRATNTSPAPTGLSQDGVRACEAGVHAEEQQGGRGPYVASRDARFVVSIVVVHIVCAVCMDLFARPAGNKSPLISALPCTRWHGPPRLRLRNILFDHGICNKGHQQPEAAEARVARGAYRACTLSPRWYLFAESVTDCVCVCRETVSLAGSGK